MEQEAKVIALHQRWAKVVDLLRYVGIEHRYKEKEYGKLWRADYKRQLEEQTMNLMNKYGNPMTNGAFSLREEDYGAESFNSELIYFLVKKDYMDISKFAAKRQLELMEMLTENLDMYEAACKRLRRMLKDPQLTKHLAKEKKAAIAKMEAEEEE